MTIDYNAKIPIYIQISESIKDMILDGELLEGDQVPSTNQLADFYKLNPATARKGLNRLVDEELVYKKRGVGMFVKEGAKEVIKKRRRDDFVTSYIKDMVRESKRLGITREEIIAYIEAEERGDLNDDSV